VVEGRRRLDRILGMPAWSPEASQARLRALEAAGGLAYWAGDMTTSGDFYAAAVVEARALADDAEVANAVYNHWFTRRPTENVVDWGRLLADDDRRLLDEALEIWTRLGDEEGVAKALWGLGEHYAYREDHAATEDATSRALAIFERRDDGFWIAWTRFTRAFGRVIARDVPGAAEDLGVAMREFRVSRDVSGLVLTMSVMASLLILAGRLADAYAVGAAATRAASETGLHLAAVWSPGSLVVPDIERATGALGEAVALGRTWSREQALDVTIRMADELAAARPGDPAPVAGA
jgi:tetratricopeptide (TPR) repeat protein